jgi:predicted metalloprotease with PDZ domain
MHLRYALVLLLSTTVAISAFSQSGKGYQFKVDLTKVVDDRIYVEVSTPKVSTDETVFFLPKIIPGTYSIADYGRFVNDFKALDKSGKELPISKTDVNGWKIKNAKKLAKITYWVDDVVDTEVEGPEIYPMAATSFEDGKLFLLNTSGLFGYLENKKNVPVKFDIVRNKEMYGSTGLVAIDTGVPLSKVQKDNQPSDANKVVDKYSVENYDRLIDSPLLYAQVDTAIIRVANAEVLIGTYSPNHVISSKQIAETVKEVLLAQSKYLGGKLPVEKYAFLFNFTDQPIIVYGALEHSYSSLYYMPELPIDRMRQNLRDFAAHEFFHIVTPLNIHSKEIHQFEFNDPKMSRHLWMYEGVTEYFAGNVQVKYGLITPEQYLDVIKRKMTAASGFRQDISFTDLSQFTLDKYGDQYGNVYQKGALIGMCLDIKLRKLSNGKYGIQNLMADLSKKYGKDHPFDDAELFDIIEKLTYPEIGTFLKTYVGNAEPLPFKEVFDYVGVSLIAERQTQRYSIGFNPPALGIEEMEGKKKLKIANAAGLSEQGHALGLQADDILLKINGEDFPELGPATSAFLAKHRDALKEGDQLTVTVLRRDGTDTWAQVDLKAPVAKVSFTERNILAFDENATPEQLAIRKAWLTPSE